MAESVGAPAVLQVEEPPERISFGDLTRVHLLRQQAAEATDGRRAAQAEERWQRALAAFESEHGRVVDAYWCSEVASAAALTERRDRSRSGPRTLTLRFHRVSDWATQDRPAVAGLLHECDELAIKAREVLRGKSRRIYLQLVMASAAHLLSLADARAAHSSEESLDEAVAVQRRELARTRAGYVAAANGEAQIVYAGGMLLGAGGLAVAAGLLGTLASVPGVDNRGFFGSLAAGAIGALVSVMARITTGRFRLRTEVGRDDLLFLGAIRPLLGALFGLALYFAVISGLLDVFALPPEGTTKEFYFLLVIAFLAGFSERWAQDMLFAGDRGRRQEAPAALETALEEPPDR